MYNLWTRANQVFFFAVSMLLLSCVLTILTKPFLPVPTPEVNKLAVNEVKRFGPFRGRDRAIMTYELGYDLTSVFNWNVKQLFVFIVAEYSSKANKLNQVVVYDDIVVSKEDAVQTFDSALNKYFLDDDKTDLRAANLTIRLCWDVMPYFGALSLETQGEAVFIMPSKYTS